MAPKTTKKPQPGPNQRRRDGVLAEAIGARVQSARDARGWTNYDLSDATGLAPETLSRMARGHIEPSASSIVKLCDALNVTSDHLLGRDKPRKRAA